jgi:hypothetical protein
VEVGKLADLIALSANPLENISNIRKLKLVLSFTCIGLFTASDGVVGVAWFDIVARAIPWRRRSRLIGLAQLISGLTGWGRERWVGLILALRSFPDDYALIFTLTGVALIPSTIAQALVGEPQPEEVNRKANGHMRGGWLKPLVTDPAFRRPMVCRRLVGMMYLAAFFTWDTRMMCCICQRAS